MRFLQALLARMGVTMLSNLKILSNQRVTVDQRRMP
jgi:hypothetical protein